MSVNGDVKYHCNQYDSKFTQHRSLKSNRSSIQGQDKYPCNQCDSIFTQQGSLKRHKISVHEGHYLLYRMTSKKNGCSCRCINCNTKFS